MRSSAGILWAVLLASLPGCSYLAARAKDLTDVVSVGGSLGSGALVRATATRFVVVEVGVRKDEHFHGWRRRQSEWVESSFGFYSSKFWSARLGEERPEEWKWTNIFRTSHTKLAFLDESSAKQLEKLEREELEYHMFVLTHSKNTPLSELFDVEMDVSLVGFGGQLIFRPFELADFFAGLFLLDLSKDDESAKESR